MQLSSSSAYIDKDTVAGLIYVSSLGTLGGSLLSLGYQQGILPDKVDDGMQLLGEKLALAGHLLGITSDNKSNSSSIDSQKVKNFISNIAKQQGLTCSIKFAINPEGYSVKKIGKTVNFCLNKEQENELENAINNSNQTTLNLHTAFIHHELTHIKRDPTPRQLLTLATGSLIPATALTFFPKSISETNVLLLLVTSQILNLMIIPTILDKYEEIRADDGIPNKRELLTAQSNSFITHHKNMIKEIDNIKNYPSLIEAYIKKRHYFSLAKIFIARTLPTKYFVTSLLFCELMHITDEHPSDLFRAKRFESRLKKLEKDELKRLLQFNLLQTLAIKLIQKQYNEIKCLLQLNLLRTALAIKLIQKQSIETDLLF